MKKDQEYIKWKKWDKSFGECSEINKKYYQAEIGHNIPKLKQNIFHEIGFGDGSFMRYGKDNGWRVTGTEINKDLVEKATDLKYEVCFSENIKHLENNHYDLIVAFDVLEHIEKNKIELLLVEVTEKLKHGGVFIARFPNGDSFLGMPYQNADITHKTIIGSEMAKFLSMSAGFSEVIIRGQAMPIISGSTRHTIQRIIAWPIKKIINIILNITFYPGSKYEFCSPNLVMIAIK